MVYLDLAVTGVFTGLGVAIGSTITKLWIEPKLQEWKDKKAEEKLRTLLIYPGFEREKKEEKVELFSGGKENEQNKF